ncbi:MAG TPA: hypothetical protein VE650_02095 [Acetobacteraceae bacterium]|nr:hypothetical protein [Acetobacteraceae bacterium]
MEHDAHPGLREERVGGLAPDQGIVHTGPGLAVHDRFGEPAHVGEPPAKLVGEAEHDLG